MMVNFSDVNLAISTGDFVVLIPVKDLDFKLELVDYKPNLNFGKNIKLCFTAKEQFKVWAKYIGELGEEL